jgi:endothelin-converting enzyme
LDPNHAKVDPCTNFDQFVCGGWRERHDMRADQGSIFAGTIMAENSQTRLRHILERSEPPEKVDADNFKKLKAGYDACLNESAIRKRGTKPLADLLAELQKIYPAKSDLVAGTKDHLTPALLFLMKSGVDALVSSGVSVSLPLYRC